MYLICFIVGSFFLLFLDLTHESYQELHNYGLEWVMLVFGAMNLGKDTAILVTFFTTQE